MIMNKDTYVHELVESIKEYATAYYLGEAIISDSEFDELVEELREVDPHHEILRIPGWGMDLSKMSSKVPHFIKMGSISKVKKMSESKVSDEVLPLIDEGYSVTYKIDGCAIEILKTDSGKVQVITRGDGEVGQDVTDKFIDYDLDKLFKNSEVKSFTAEAVLPYDDVPKDTITHPRNITAGLLSSTRNVDMEMVNKLRIYLHAPHDESGKVLMDTLMSGSLDPRITPTPHVFYKSVTDDGRTVYTTVCKEDGPNHISDMVLSDIISPKISIIHKTRRWSIPTDGLVVRSKDGQSTYAIKIDTEVVDTVVQRIQWNMTRTGKFVPLVYVKPVLVNGAMIRKASGHNYMNIMNMHVGVGSTVKLVRSGEIIPYIKEVVTESSDHGAPTHCPHCGSDVKLQGSDIYCSNDNCTELVKQRYLHYLITVTRNVDNAGYSTYSRFLDLLNPSSYKMIMTENTYYHKVRSNQGNSATDMIMYHILRELETPKDIGYYLIGLGIDGLGWGSIEKYGDLLYRYLYLMEDIEFNRPPRVSTKAHSYLIDNREDLNDLLKICPITPPEKPVEVNKYAVPVCITGSLVKYKSRNDIFKDHPQIVSADIKKAKYLVTNSDKMTSKMKYAIANDIPVITEEELYELLGGL